MAMRDGGKVKLCSLTETQTSGFMPVQVLAVQLEPFFSYRTGGVTRRFAAKGVNFEYDFVIRCWNITELPEGVEYAVLNGKQYHIDAEPIFDEDALDLTLTRLEEFFDVLTEQAVSTGSGVLYSD